MFTKLLMFFVCLNLLPAADQASRQMARDYLKELIEIDTTDSHGDVTRAANAMARRLLDAGFPAGDVAVVGAAPNRGNVIARLRGTGKGKPVLFLAHLDVVEARRTDWSTDPFTLVEKDGYFYGRGTTDDKSGAALFAVAFAQLKLEGYRPQRDLILALTTGEESGDGNGVKWLLANSRSLIDAEYCINADAGGGQIRKGKRLAFAIQAAEKGYATFRIT
ncbi:MAG TPA: M20/M25/M40 family metallo-hydrolase, partial [Novimethylophilus sp.]|uniref:M20/M25/M40 family metallo-hydrolase n=1 Tax=Novimethylophilus sp. TaxID=2137426 RepID=UPI002F426B92